MSAHTGGLRTYLDVRGARPSKRRRLRKISRASRKANTP